MNSEEIYLDEDVDTIIASGPLPVIPNAQDVQVAAAAALSTFDSQSESESDESDDEFEQVAEREQGDVVMNEFVSLNIKLEDKQGGDVQDAPHVQVELKSIPAADQVLLLDEESEETSSDEDEDNMYGDDDVEEIATYGELKSMLDSMTRDNDVAAPVPTAAELLFTESIQSFDNLVIDENDAVSLAGHVISRLEGTIVVKASKDSQVLDEGSILVTNGKQLLGPVEDIFGPVQTPMYILRDPSALGVEDCGIIAEIGDAVYSVDKLAKPVAEEELLRVKGYDSDDEEGVETKPDVECEFSDDEAEAAYRRSLKSKRKGMMNNHKTTHAPKPQRRPRQHNRTHGQSTRPPTRLQHPQPMYLADHPAMHNQYHFMQSSDVNGQQNTFVPVTFEPRHAFGSGAPQRPHGFGPRATPPPPPPK